MVKSLAGALDGDLVVVERGVRARQLLRGQPARDDVVREHGGQLRAVGQQRLQRIGRDRLERRVGRGEHGDVLQRC